MPADFEAEVAALEAACPGATMLDTPGQRVVGLPSIDMTGQWSPDKVRALLICNNWPSERPRLLVEATLLRDGAEPVGFNREIINGEAWFSYSFDAPYSADYPELIPVMRGWLKRFDGRTD